MAASNPVAEALGAVSEELDLVGDALTSLGAKVDIVLENQQQDSQVLREIQRALGSLADSVRELPELRRRVATLEGSRGAHADAE